MKLKTHYVLSLGGTHCNGSGIAGSSLTITYYISR
jgi:hypothetical protein